MILGIVIIFEKLKIDIESSSLIVRIFMEIFLVNNFWD